MKNLYKTFALAAVAAVSLFSAQSAKAQAINDFTSSAVLLDAIDDDEPVLTSAAFDSNDPIARGLLAFYMSSLDLAKKRIKEGRVFSKEDIQILLKPGLQLGLTEEYIRAYVGLPAK